MVVAVAGLIRGGHEARVAFQVNTYTTSDQSVDDVAMDPAGNFLITWLDEKTGRLTARHFDAAGAPGGGEIDLGTGTDSARAIAGAVNDFTVLRDSATFPADLTDGALTHWKIVGQRLTATCGDGALQPGEQCDDGGNADGDGCARTCVVESCHTCSGAPSGCAPVVACGNADGCCLPGCTASTDDDCPAHVSGARLAIRDADLGSGEYRRSIVFATTDPAIDTTPGTGIDPATDGASLQVYNASGVGDSACFDLEPAYTAVWQTNLDPRAPVLRYTDPALGNGATTNGACRLARVKDGKLLKVACRGARIGRGHPALTYSLDEPSQGSVAVRFKSGTIEYCAVFGGTVTSDVPSRSFTAKHAPTPSVCPPPPGPCP